MKYEVILTRNAQRQLNDAYCWYVENAPHMARRWLDGFAGTLDELVDNPQQHAEVHEVDASTEDLRNVFYGVGRKKTHRAVFVIRSRQVVVYSIRHMAQRDLALDDLVE